ncbi:hypothetical protein Nepgr_023639 [Nepenthes gracilis]|uniref:NAC domain-containing protein n=1 Tax=Nepenthes gracilis TaxID=150966 RepID=A0AAD3T4A0_NEPGR|nr:hypothetical protein Nepgr_023639 [Nepenthes gracilis]
MMVGAPGESPPPPPPPPPPGEHASSALYSMTQEHACVCKEKKSSTSMEINGSCVPPGFRFHPTEEELVGYYLKRKINSLNIDLDVIIDIDLYRMEPWDIQERCKLGYDEQNEWYFFSHKDKKYPTGTRTNRATAAGFWKATGRDKAVLSKNKIIGMRKTLVFYKGRAPNGKKTDWIIHEYQLQSSEHAPPQEEGWVVCRAFKKPCPSHRQGFEAWSHNYYVRNNMLIGSSPMLDSNQACASFNQQLTPFDFDQELMADDIKLNDNDQTVDLPQLDSPSISTSLATKEGFQGVNNLEYNYDDKSNDCWDFFDGMISSEMPHHDHYDHAENQMGNFGFFPNL